MKEIFIHKDSRMFYCDTAQPFVYIAESLEIALFCIDGIQVDQAISPCEKNTLLLLEEHKIYTFHMPANGILLITKLPLTMQEAMPQYYQSPFQHNEIRSLCIMCAKIVGNERMEDLLRQSYVCKLCYLVLNHYSYRGESLKETSTSPIDERMKQIHSIIYQQSSENISLVSLANQLHLSPQYVSQIFKSFFGCTFLHYVANIRLYKAMPAIQQTSKSLLSIAMEYGFANIRSFQTSFSQTFHITPKQYRKKLMQRDVPNITFHDDPMYVSFIEKEYQLLPDPYQEEKEEIFQFELHAGRKGRQLQHTWKNLMTVGRARLLLNDDIRRQLSEIQKEIGFKMIRFHGIFNEDMHVYDEDEHGSAIYNFHQVNDVLDFLLKLDLKPFLELGFMPKKLALNPNMTIIDQMFIVSPPKDIKKWNILVQSFIKNCINRYGEEEVYSWYFEFWNNGGLDYDEKAGPRDRKFWQGTMDEYLEFYEATYHAVKEIHPELRIGGPSISILLLKNFPENLTSYLQFMRKHKCMIDFLTLHVYPTFYGDLMGEYTTELLPFKSKVDTIQQWMKKQNLKTEIHITEWSTWGYQASPNFNDECAKALYLIQSMVDTLDQVNSMGHWTFSDFTETMNTKQSYIYSGKAGLITGNGIKKAAYHAYSLMRKLGDVELDKGDNFIFTRRNKNYQLLLFRNEQPRNPIKVSSQFHMKLQQIPNGTYEKKTTFLSKESGSSYDVWKKMGSRLEIMEEDVTFLKASALMTYKKETIHIIDHQDQEIRNVKENEAVLIEWIYKY